MMSELTGNAPLTTHTMVLHTSSSVRPVLLGALSGLLEAAPEQDLLDEWFARALLELFAAAVVRCAIREEDDDAQAEEELHRIQQVKVIILKNWFIPIMYIH